MGVWRFLGDLHPKLVHFPLVLLLAGLLFDAAGLVWRSARCHWAAKVLTSAGTVLLLVTFICGIYAEIWAGRAGIPHEQIELHELFANIASWGFVILAAWRQFLGQSARRLMRAYVLIGLGWYALLVVTAHFGGALVYEYGAGVTGARALSAPSLHDLNTLATRQTDLNLRYSEMMHHIFGWMTVALAASLLIEAGFPTRAHRLRWVGPLLLLLGGVFLFFFADLDLYDFLDPRQLRDREVQLHKVLAIVLVAVGVFGMRRAIRQARAGRDDATEGREPPPGGERQPIAAPPASPAGLGAGVQGKVIAVMALIGGGMLFTHIHTVAPYANVAAGVYIAHVVMGTVALLIGASRLLADAVPGRRRLFSFAFATLLCVEGALLVTYNEGLPWYIGYGAYNRWGANGGTIAPYGDRRAELTFDNDTQTLEVRVLDRFTEAPVAVPASELTLLIDQGYEELAIPLRAVDDQGERGAARGGGHSRFAAKAPFLKDVWGFCARLPLPMGDGRAMKMGYFDPWVTPLIQAVPPNEVARYVCPMHEGIRSQEPGDCSLCGMPLVSMGATARTTMHDDAYGMTLTGGTGESARTILVFTPEKDGEVLQNLAVVHEHLLHLIVVSADLSYFDHVHPVRQPDGSLTLDYTFPGPGRYLLFAEFTPNGDRSQAFRFPVAIGAPGPEQPVTLTVLPSPSGPLQQDPSIVSQVVLTPREPIPGVHTQVLVRLTQDGKPITDLERYIGAMGHCVMISEDTQTYVHCHPEQLRMPSLADRGGPEVAFHVRFPRAGKYKVWPQFKRGDTILVAPFVIEVKESPLPGWVIDLVYSE